MKNKGMYTLIVAVVLTVGYATYDVLSEKKSESTKEVSSKILSLVKDQVSEVWLDRYDQSPTEIFKLTRSDKGWLIQSKSRNLEPELADQSSVVDFIDGICLEKSKEIVKSDSNIDWKLYGLAEPKAIIGLKTNDGSTYKVFISKVKNFSGDAYIKVEGQVRVLVANSTWYQKIERKSFDFRDKRILQAAPTSVSKFHFRKNAQTFTLNSKDAKWSLLEKPDWEVDQTKSSDAIYMLSSMQVIEIVDNKEEILKQEKNLKTHASNFQIEVDLRTGTEKNQKWKANFFENQKKEYAVLITNSENQMVTRLVKIASQDYEKIRNLDLGHFRDRRYAFVFDRDEVKRIKLKLGLFDAEFEKKDSDKKDAEWKILQPDANLVYELERVKSIPALVRNMEIGDFDPNIKLPIRRTQNDYPSVKISFENSQGKTLFEGEFDGHYQKKEDSITKSYLVSKTNKTEKQFGVDEGSFKAIGFDTLIKKK